MRAWCLAVVLGVGVLGASLESARAGDEKADADKALREKWAEHTGDLPFVFGYANGMKEVEFTGRPPMYFFTATW